jgi:hypothetical protein
LNKIRNKWHQQRSFLTYKFNVFVDYMLVKIKKKIILIHIKIKLITTVATYSDGIHQASRGRLGITALFGKYSCWSMIRSYPLLEEASDEILSSFTDDEVLLASSLPPKIAPFDAAMLYALTIPRFEGDSVRWYGAFVGLLYKGWLVKDAHSGCYRFSLLADSLKAKLQQMITGHSVLNDQEQFDKYVLHWATQLAGISDEAYRSNSSKAMCMYFQLYYCHFEYVLDLFYDAEADHLQKQLQLAGNKLASSDSADGAEDGSNGGVGGKRKPLFSRLVMRNGARGSSGNINPTTGTNTANHTGGAGKNAAAAGNTAANTTTTTPANTTVNTTANTAVNSAANSNFTIISKPVGRGRSSNRGVASEAVSRASSTLNVFAKMNKEEGRRRLSVDRKTEVARILAGNMGAFLTAIFSPYTAKDIAKKIFDAIGKPWPLSLFSYNKAALTRTARSSHYYFISEIRKSTCFKVSTSYYNSG